jgi:hypothetical protein
MRIRRRNLAWLSVIGALIALVFVSGAATAELMVVLLGLYGVALAASLLEVQPARLRESVASSPLTRMRMSTEAREATDRARRRGNLFPSDLTLIDIGLISSQSTDEGMVMRKSRTVSGDDDGVRPFITLHVKPSEADRNAIIRFEIIDHNGQQQYVHEMKTYLRDGEMNILADHHLPLFENEQVGSANGEWDLRVSVDSALAGVLSFSVTPSLQQRNHQMRRSRLQDRPQEDAPLTLEELLRSQQNPNRENRDRNQG